MAEIDEVIRNIEYVVGPHGQTVVLVPPKIPEVSLDKKEEVNAWCFVALIFSAFLGIICLSLGIVYGKFVFPREDRYDEKNLQWVITACSLLGFAALFALIIIISCCYMTTSKKSHVSQFMHKRGSPRYLAYQALERQREEEAFTRSYEEFTPESALADDFPSYPDNHREHSSHASRSHQRQLAAGAYPSWNRRHNYPSRNYSPLPSQPFGRPSSPLRSGQPMQPMQDYPQHRTEFSISRGYTSGAESPYRSSPIGERSFSPSSDITYLSSHASGPETQ